MTTDAIIHLRVPAATKARWVRASRASGMRLTDWICQQIEQEPKMQPPVRIVIPDDLPFSALRVSRGAEGHVSFDMTAIERIEAASALPAGFFAQQPEAWLSGVITRWYADHLASGGAPDPVMHDLIAEVEAEDAHGHGYSHEPGRA